MLFRSLPARAPAAVIGRKHKIVCRQLAVIAVHLRQAQDVTPCVLGLLHAGQDGPDAVFDPPDAEGGKDRAAPLPQTPSLPPPIDNVNR